MQSAFAVLARVMGFHTRLAVGYQGGTVRGGTAVLTTRDLKVWPEVEFSGVGWLPFPAWPAGQGAKGATSRSPAPNPIAQALQNQRQINRAHPAAGAHQRGPRAAPATQPILPPGWHGGCGCWLPPRPPRPRAWAHSSPPRPCVAGDSAARPIREPVWSGRGSTPWTGWASTAWPCPRRSRHPEIADRAGARFTGVTAPMRSLAPAVDAVRYNRGAPVLVGTPDEGWAAAREVQAALRSGASLGTRVRAWVSTAPLMRRRAD